MGCATTTVKISLISFNILLAILSIGAIIWIAINPDALESEVAIGSYVLCSLVLIFAFLGVFAAIRESVCLTATCAVFLLLLAILQIIATSIDINDRKTMSGIKSVQKAWGTAHMDTIQMEYKCCGRDSTQDYIHANLEIPRSCYKDPNHAIIENLHTEGCVTKLQDYYDGETVRFTIVSWILIGFELIGFLLAVFLAINLRNKQRRMQF